MEPMTRQELLALGQVPTTNIELAGRACGFARQHSYNLAKAGTFPVPVHRIGRRYRVPTAPLLRFLGIEPDESDHTDDTPRPTSNGEAVTSRVISRVLDFTDLPPTPTWMINRRGRVKAIYADEMYRVDGEKISGADIIARGYIHPEARR
jgi:hypothetical protein